MIVKYRVHSRFTLRVQTRICDLYIICFKQVISRLTFSIARAQSPTPSLQLQLQFRPWVGALRNGQPIRQGWLYSSLRTFW